MLNFYEPRKIGSWCVYRVGETTPQKEAEENHDEEGATKKIRPYLRQYFLLASHFIYED